MLFAKQSERVRNYSASHAGIKLALMVDRIPERELESKTIQIAFLRIKVMSVLNAGAGKVLRIIQHMQMLNFGLRTLKSFLLNLVHGQKDAQWIASIRLVTMNLEMFGGQLFLNKRPIACREITG